MKSLIKYTGLALVILGVAILVALFHYGLTFVNKLMAIPFFFILSGIVIFVWRLKKESRY